jgi:hypothetical protein
LRPVCLRQFKLCLCFIEEAVLCLTLTQGLMTQGINCSLECTRIRQLSMHIALNHIPFSGSRAAFWQAYSKTKRPKAQKEPRNRKASPKREDGLSPHASHLRVVKGKPVGCSWCVVAFKQSARQADSSGPVYTAGKTWVLGLPATFSKVLS